MTKKHDFLIGKKWTGAVETVPVTNPYTQEVIADVSLATPQEIDRAIGLAVETFQTTRNLPSYMRRNICNQVAEGIEKRKEEFSRTLAMESGKPLVYSRAEVDRSISTFRIAAEEATRIHGEVLNLDVTEPAKDKTGITRRFPLGAISGISPFNFPLNLVSHKVAPALAVGNPIVLKPASSTPLTALLLGEVILDTDAPEGVFSVVPCKSRDATALVEDPRLQLVSFTGSPPIGWDIKKRAGKKRVILELGGNAGVIVEPDADLDFAAKRVCFGAFSFSGQVCISVQRTYVHESVFDSFIDKLASETQKLKKGDPLDESTTFGPMIDTGNSERIESWVKEALDDGAKLVTGGKRDGAFFDPTILTNVKRDKKVVCEEAFGPLLVVEPYRDFQEALDTINDSDFGLQAGVFTNHLDLSMRAFNQLHVGGVVLNDVPTFRVDNMPYGGVKDSGFGREGIKYTIEEMTEIKLLVMNKYL
ncbi:glyceraldehyde-3-phosphate dehydrogenase (NADP+) [Nitrospina gracilis]|uniref:aldehyde dehydrogenase family protein n=1 Tax=Nitrospina sp. Nb-3 TaxID=2940485 RepID=UPI001F390C26|nr:aldehyde dehydrogenase family protein [Nitrospina sp. Nb-3]MCF8724705.1 glyceraldehyde-3-phosphate dehydrogenase (NADP+) [Nitrospina sp. Nb-3]